MCFEENHEAAVPSSTTKKLHLAPIMSVEAFLHTNDNIFIKKLKKFCTKAARICILLDLLLLIYQIHLYKLQYLELNECTPQTL